VSEGRDLSLTREQIIGLLTELGQELDARGVLPGGADRHAKVILDLPGITVSVPSPHYLLALKVQAARIDRDQDDIRFLARETGAKTADDVMRIAEQVIGGNRLLPKAQFIVQEMFPEAPAEPSPP
jgi:hypothetical protein